MANNKSSPSPGACFQASFLSIFWFFFRQVNPAKQLLWPTIVVLVPPKQINQSAFFQPSTRVEMGGEIWDTKTLNLSHNIVCCRCWFDVLHFSPCWLTCHLTKTWEGNPHLLQPGALFTFLQDQRNLAKQKVISFVFCLTKDL